ncbi:MAG: 6-phosphogluconolactonase [Bryobacterales bacterium]|nr:6-phosphogluconolactonase [Bryobacterales bacterium]
MSVHQYIQPDAAAAAGACARHILAQLEAAAAGKDQVTMAVSGGNSPRPIFEALARSGFDWRMVHLFFVDERCVPPMDAQSNFKMVMETFVTPARFPRAQVHRVETELEPHRAAQQYARALQHVFALEPGDTPHFDLIHLGMGPDAHTASLFPGDPLIENRDGLAAATYVEKFQQWRVTLLPRVLLGARHTVMFAPGADKAEAMRTVLDGGFDALKYPAQIPAHLGRGVAWFMDAASARLLEE